MINLDPEYFQYYRNDREEGPTFDCLLETFRVRSGRRVPAVRRGGTARVR